LRGRVGEEGVRVGLGFGGGADGDTPLQKRSQRHKWRFEEVLLRKMHEKKVTKKVTVTF
jgi:hypothetical protein